MTKKRILIVEDEGVIALDEKLIMLRMGYEVTGIAISGEKAIELVETDKPDVVLMDILLAGDMDGLEATLKIRELYQIPVIYVTAYGDKDQSKSLEIPPPEGFGYVVKPFTEEELGSEVERLIG